MQNLQNQLSYFKKRYGECEANAKNILPNITIIADYSIQPGDLAFKEVVAKLRGFIPNSSVDIAPISPFNTVETGFVLAETALNATHPYNAYLVNTAPRKDDKKERDKNEGEKLAVAVLPHNHSLIAGVNSGYTFSYVKQYAEIYELDIPNKGSQFRSRDIYPAILYVLIKGQTEISKEELHEILPAHIADYYPKGIKNIIKRKIDNSEIPDPMENAIIYTDGYGNLKAHLDKDNHVHLEGRKFTIYINSKLCQAILTEGSFDVKDGEFALSTGSSGWKVGDNGKMKFSEVFKRGGNASDHFNYPASGSKIYAVPTNIFLKLKQKLMSLNELKYISDKAIFSGIINAGLIEGLNFEKVSNILKDENILKQLLFNIA
ncbi:hypothetical protein ACFL0U_00470 [Pseudomonadota bacterium]